MYVDLIVFILLIIAVVAFFRRFSSFVYLVISMDILYRLLHFIADNLKVPELTALINKYVPTNVVGLVSNYIGTKGIFYIILIWFMFFMYCIFLFYIIRILVKRNL
ncbi:MAG: hypothetical protein IJ105_02790 [Bacilli bacterium]|nr:hypothetical protein [Bacilli bacterium]